MKDVVFVSGAFGDQRYIDQQIRLGKSLYLLYPKNAKYFWTNEFPDGTKPFDESMYGFKPHIIDHVRKLGNKKIVFFDPACILVDKVDYYFDIMPDYGVIAAMDDNLLCNYCGDAAYEYFGITRQHSKEMCQHLVGGSLYVFDFDIPLCCDIFDTWLQAEKNGIFGKWDTPGHRNDESCMALSLYKHGSRPTPYDLARYNDVCNPIVIKIHFK